MTEGEQIMLGMLIIAFFCGILFLASGLADIGSALSLDNLLNDPLESLSIGGSGSLKVIVGLVLVVAVIAPQSLKLIYNH